MGYSPLGCRVSYDLETKQQQEQKIPNSSGSSLLPLVPSPESTPSSVLPRWLPCTSIWSLCFQLHPPEDPSSHRASLSFSDLIPSLFSHDPHEWLPTAYKWNSNFLLWSVRPCTVSPGSPCSNHTGSSAPQHIKVLSAWCLRVLHLDHASAELDTAPALNSAQPSRCRLSSMVTSEMASLTPATHDHSPCHHPGSFHS